MKYIVYKITLASQILFFLLTNGCSSNSLFGLRNTFHSDYAYSGTIIVSGQIPETPISASDLLASNNSSPTREPQLFAPVMSYIPPVVGFLPADNEPWLEISRNLKVLFLYRGKDLVKKISAEGTIALAPGRYALQHKQKKPLWYAPDAYFTKRHLLVPSASDRTRYRRGALGKHVLYASTTFAIHSSPLWDSDVGGLRVAQGDLSSIYYMLPIGSAIVVK